MAKVKKFELDNYGFDTGLDVPDFDFAMPKQKDDRNPASKIAGGFITGAKDRVTSPSFIRSMVKNSLPVGYGSAIDLADQAAGSLKSLYNDAAQEIKPAIKDLKRITKRIIPSAESVLPRAMSLKIKAWAENNPDDPKVLTAEQQRDASLQMQLGDIFQYETEARLEKEALDDAKDSIKDGIDHSRFRDQLGQLNAMRISLQQLAGYKTKVEANFQRKSLELQFRHYFVASDSLIEQKRQNAIVESTLQGILKNTALPEFVKLRNTENLQQIMRNKFLGGVTDTLFGKRKEFMSLVMKSLGDSARTKIKGTVSDFRAGLSGADMALDAGEAQSEMGGPGGLETGGQLAGGEAAASLARRTGKKIREKLGQNETVTRVGNKVQTTVENMPQLLTEYSRGNKHEGGFGGGFVRFIKDAILGVAAQDSTLTEGSLDNAGSMMEPQSPTRGTNKAITEIIPGFLSRIYRELKIIRTGDATIPLSSYDYTTNTFNDRDKIAKNVLKSVVKEKDQQNTTEQIDRLIDQIDPNKTLSPEQRTLLGRQMLNDNVNTKGGMKSRMVNPETYTGAAGQHSLKYADLFEQYLQNDTDGTKELAFTREFNKLGNMITGGRKAIQDHANIGNREYLEEAGLVDKNSQRINMERWLNYYYGAQGTPTPTLGGGPVPPGTPTPVPVPPSVPTPGSNNGGGPLPFGPVPPTPFPILDGSQEPIVPPTPLIQPVPPATPSFGNPPSNISGLPSTIIPATPNVLQNIPSTPAVDPMYRQERREMVQPIPSVPVPPTLPLPSSVINNPVPSFGNRFNNGMPSNGSVLPTRSLFQPSQAMNPLYRQDRTSLLQSVAQPTLSETVQIQPIVVEPIIAPAPPPTVTLGNDAMISAIKEHSSRSASEIMSETLLRIEEKLKAGLDVRGSLNGEQMDAAPRGGRWWNQSLEQAAGNVLGAAGSALNYTRKKVSGVVGQAFSNAAAIGGGVLGMVRKGVQSGVERMRGIADIYMKDENSPRLLKAKLKLGHYKDQTTGKVIKSFKDIKGAVVDETGNIVLKAEEIGDAFVKKGVVRQAVSALGAVAGGVKAVGQTVMANAGVLYNAAFQLSKKAFGLLSTPQDVYIHGKNDPVLLARTMAAGGYFSRITGKAIRHPGDIDGVVLDDVGNVVLSAAEFAQGIFDKRGKPLRTGMAKLLGGAKDLLSAGLKRVVGAGKWISSKVKGGIDNAGSVLTNVLKHGITLGGGKDLLSRLTEIRDLLKERLPVPKMKISGDIDGDGDRDGSFEDLRSKAKAKEETTIDPATGEVVKGAKGFGLMAGIKGLYDKLRGKKQNNDGDDDEEDEDDGDTIVGGIGGDSNSRDNRRARRLARRRPGFRQTRGIWNKTKWLGSAAGRGIGNVAKWGAGAVGLGAGGMLAGAGSAVATGAGALASGAVTVGGAVLGGLGALATGIGAILASPVVLGALAVAAVGAGAYYGIKYLTRTKLDMFTKIRYAQYGFPASDTEHFATVMGVEDQLKDALVFGPGGATLDEKKIDGKKIVESFGVDLENKPALNKMLIWFKERFKPVFLTHVTALKSIDPNLGLGDLDKLTPEQKKQYLKLTAFPDGPYNVNVSPFPTGDGLSAGASEVAALVTAAQTEVDTLAKDKQGKSKTGLDVKAGVTAAAGAAGLAANSTKPAIAPVPPKLNSQALTEINKQTTPSTGLGDNGNIISVMGTAIAENRFAVGRIPALTAVRYKTYGLKSMELDKVRAIDTLEVAVTKDLTWAKGNVAGWKGSVEKMIVTMGSAFGVEGINNNNASNWIAWFNLRFLPVFLKFATSVATATNKQNLELAVGALKPQQNVDVAIEVHTTKSTYSGKSVDVWNVPSSPWPGYETNNDIASVEPNIAALKEIAKTAVLDEQTSKALTDIGKKQTTPNATSPNGQPQKPVEPVPTTMLGKFKQSISNVVSGAKDVITGGAKTTVSQPAGVAAGVGVGGIVGGGAEFTHPGKGTGGDVNSIPMPTANRSFAALKETIGAASKMVGVDEKLMQTMAAIESGFDYTVKAKESSATGLYQFLTKDRPGKISTWTSMMQKHAAKYGIAPGTLATDPRANALMGGEFIKENANALKTVLKRPLTDTDLYIAHFLGAGGAKKLLAAPPDALAADLMPGPATSNPSIFYTNGGSRTVAQLYSFFNDLVRRKGAKFGIGSGSEAIVMKQPPAKPVGETAVGSATSTPVAPPTPKVASPGPTTGTPTTPNATTPVAGKVVAPAGGKVAPVVGAAITAAVVAKPETASTTPAPVKTTSNALGPLFKPNSQPVPESTPRPVSIPTKTETVVSTAGYAPTVGYKAPPVSNDAGVAAMASGFVSPRSRDIMAQTSYQKDLAAERLGKMHGVLDESHKIHKESLGVLIRIAAAVEAGNAMKNAAPASNTATAPQAPNVVQKAQQQSRSAPSAPVSMAKPTY